MTIGFEWTSQHFEEQSLKPLLRDGDNKRGYNPSAHALWAVNYDRIDKGAFDDYEKEGGVDFVVIPPRTSFSRERKLENYLNSFRDSLWYMNFNNDRSCTQLKVVKGLLFDSPSENTLRSIGFRIGKQPTFVVCDYEIYQGKPNNQFIEEVLEEIKKSTDKLSSLHHPSQYPLM